MCPTAAEYDLTGTRIHATKPVSVLGGHDCSFVPYDRYACDHLEESMFPIEALGRDLVVTAPKSVASVSAVPGSPDSLYLRVLSAAPANQVTIDPPVSPPATLAEGEWIEIGPIAQDVRVHATDKILVGQFMVGENFAGLPAGAGDPSLSVAIPTEQYPRATPSSRRARTRTTSSTSSRPPGRRCSSTARRCPAGAFTPIGATGLAVARHVIQDGTHTVASPSPVGIVVYGYGSYTSYMVPGGLNSVEPRDHRGPQVTTR